MIRDFHENRKMECYEATIEIEQDVSCEVELGDTILSSIVYLLFRYSNEREMVLHIKRNISDEEVRVAKFKYDHDNSCNEFKSNIVKKLEGCIKSGEVQAMNMDSKVFVAFTNHDQKYMDYFKRIDTSGNKYEVLMNVVVVQKKILMKIAYNGEMYYKKKIENIKEHLTGIIEEFICNGDKIIKNIDYVTEDEKNNILNVFNGIINSGNRKTINERFQEVAEKFKDSTALNDYQGEITFRELDRLSNKLGRYLMGNGVGIGDIVGIIMDRSKFTVALMIGIMKAGGTYLPIDKAFPKERKKLLLKDSQTKLLITDENIPDLEINQVHIHELLKSKNLESISDDKIEIEYSSNNIAYVLYTSGSTGKPKGVRVSHTNVLGYVEAFKEEFKISSEDVILQQATYTFDTFVEEVYPGLLTGSTVVVIKKEQLLDMDEFKDVILKNKVSIISSTPYIVDRLNSLDILKSLRLVISGGAVLRTDNMDNLMKNMEVYNTYGPTETTVCATYFNCKNLKEFNTIPIGKPIKNYHVLIVDQYGRLCPVGVQGEILIGGVGVTDGYLSDECKTKKAFVRTEFYGEQIMYKTGDLGRWLPDGNVEFMGRKDFQIKIRGYRIEVGEIETTILNYGGIKDVIVKTVENNGKDYLCAYIASDFTVDTQHLKGFLNDNLPTYMVPTFIVSMEEFPMLDNHKVDIESLWNPFQNSNEINSKENIELKDDIEKRVYDIWRGILGHCDFTCKMSFFDVGGNSLNIVEVSEKISKSFNIEMKIVTLFNNPDISSISKEIRKNWDMNEERDKKIRSVTRAKRMKDNIKKLKGMKER